MRVLIIGALGMLAGDVIRELEGEHELIKRDQHDLDICDRPHVLREISELRPDLIINCAAYTHVDGCETEKDKAFAVNADGVRNLALACKEQGAKLFHISTDFVFDGAKHEPYLETDETGPLSVYGGSKLAGEKHIQELLDRHVIIRTSWLFGKGGKNFVATIRKLSQNGRELRIVNDQRGSPTYTLDLARAIKELIAKPSRGIYHVSNTGNCTWYDFGLKIVELTESASRVVPVATTEFPLPARRPPYSVMNTEKFIAETGMVPRTWQEALKHYLQDEC